MRTNTEKNLTIKVLLVCSLFIGCLNPFSVAVAQQGVLREVYTDIAGGSLDALTNNPAFPDNPSSAGVLDEFEAPQNAGNNYGQRVRGFIEAPQTGNYIFWIASDDQSQLFLSTNEDPANKRPIASVSAWTQFRSWNEEPNQTSAPINLQEGDRYYIEALMAEGGGGDHLSARWQLPDGTIEEPIPGIRLLVELIPPEIAVPPQDVRVTEREPATFEIQMVNEGPVAFQWQRGEEDIPGATNRTYTLPSAALSDDGAQFRVTVTNMFGTVTSPSARLRVDPDVEAPFLESVFNPGESNLVTVVYSEPVEEASATNPSHYTIDQGIDVVDASLNPDLRTVVLRTTPLTLGTTYRLTVENVRDRAATPNPVATGTREHFTYAITPLDVGVVLGLLDDDATRRVDVVLVADAEQELQPEGVLRDRVLDDAVGEVRVRHGQQLVVERSDPRDTQADVLDDARVVVPLDPVADSERLVGVDEHAGHEVLDDVLHRKADSQRRRGGDGRQRLQEVTVIGHPEGNGDGDEDNTDTDDFLQRPPGVRIEVAGLERPVDNRQHNRLPQDVDEDEDDDENGCRGDGLRGWHTETFEQVGERLDLHHFSNTAVCPRT
jgi:hypothetical protein